MATVMPTPAVAVSPAYLLRLEAFDFLIRCHGWLGILTGLIFNWRLKKQRSRLRSRGKRGTGCKSNREFQKLSAFHASSYVVSRMMRKEFRRRDLNSA
jgi:hypothetical protein